jgi:hypothetical protein
MQHSLAGPFDGNVIVPDRPLKLPVGKRLRIQVEVDAPVKKPRLRRSHRIIGTGEVSSGIPDLTTNKAHLEKFGAS